MTVLITLVMISSSTTSQQVYVEQTTERDFWDPQLTVVYNSQ